MLFPNSLQYFHRQNSTDHSVSPTFPVTEWIFKQNRRDLTLPLPCWIRKYGRARLWDTALKFFSAVLRITSPDHLAEPYSNNTMLSDLIRTVLKLWSNRLSGFFTLFFAKQCKEMYFNWVQHNYFSSLNQEYHCFVPLSLPKQSSFLSIKQTRHLLFVFREPSNILTEPILGTKQRDQAISHLPFASGSKRVLAR